MISVSGDDRERPVDKYCVSEGEQRKGPLYLGTQEVQFEHDTECIWNRGS